MNGEWGGVVGVPQTSGVLARAGTGAARSQSPTVFPDISAEVGLCVVIHTIYQLERF